MWLEEEGRHHYGNNPLQETQMHLCLSRWRRQSMTFLFVLIGLICPRPNALAAQSEDEAQVRHSIEAFYKAFNSHSFDGASEFTTDDWNHINPNGGWTRGRDAVLAELKRVHSSVLKGVSDTMENLSIRFASDDVAVAIVTSRVGTYYLPNGTKHENERQRRCFIVVRRTGRWLIMQDQNTVIRGSKP
jgi:uncharacterized protein (TIGR02246 family)